MRTMWMIALLATAMLAGCAGEPADTDPTQTNTGTGAEAGTGEVNETNAAPELAAMIDRDNGTVPFGVTFSIDGSDADGDNLTWSLAMNGSAFATGDVPEDFLLNVTVPGEHVYELILSDGNASVSQNFTIQAVEPLQEEVFQPVTLQQDILLACPHCSMDADVGDSLCLAIELDDNGLDCAFWPVDAAWIGREWAASGTFIPVVEFFPDCSAKGIIDYSLDASGTIPPGTGCIVMFDIIDPVVTAKVVIS